MGSNTKRNLFDHYAKSASAAGLHSTDETLLCPLCWQGTKYGDLSLEHIVPSEVGGNRVVLTCTQCNNSHGSLYDAHLAQFQKSMDGFSGHGTIPAKLEVLGKTVTANVAWGDGFKHINIVGKASNPAEVQAMQEDASAGRFDELHLRLNFGYIKPRFQTGLLRCAYLALFKCFGYEYARADVVQVLRRRICNMDIEQPRLGSLIGELRKETIPYTDPYFIVPGNVSGIQFYLVVIRLKKETETFHFVCMPVPVQQCGEFFEKMERHPIDNNGVKLTIPHELVFT